MHLRDWLQQCGVRFVAMDSAIGALDSRTGWESMAATNLGIDIDRAREDGESLSSRKQTFIWFFETGTADDPKRLEPEAATASDARWW